MLGQSHEGHVVRPHMGLAGHTASPIYGSIILDLARAPKSKKSFFFSTMSLGLVDNLP